MNRTSRLIGRHLIWACAALVVACATCGVCLAEPAQKQPNVVIFLADDLGYGDLGCYGSPTCRTPHLDRLAQQGARLTQFNCPAPFCAPTRASLLTGRYPFRCGLMDNPIPDGRPAGDVRHLPVGEKLLPEVLGIANAMIGKWHLGHQPEWLPTRRGFQSYFGIPYSNDMRPVRLLAGEETAEYPVVQATLTERYTARALDFIDTHKQAPWFLYLAYAAPHKPLACSEAFYRRGEQGLYEKVIAELDASVGRVLEKLDALQLADHTLVIFTSDNGPWYGGSAGGLRGMKGTSYEGGYRVPMIARWPGQIAADKTIDALATTPDLFATVLDAQGIAAPSDRTIDGQSLLPLLRGQTERTPHEFIVGQAGGRLGTIRNQRWKLHIVPPPNNRVPPPNDKPWVDPRGPDGVTILAPYEQYSPADFPGIQTGDPPHPGQLFDLENDPTEQHDVAAKHPEIVAMLQRQFKSLATLAPPGESQP